VACDLMPGPPPPHLYRFDLESLFYVMILVACHYRDGEEVENPPFQEWEDLETEDLLTKKLSFFFGPMPKPTFKLPRPPRLELFLYKMIRDGYNARNHSAILPRTGSGRFTSPTFDNETLGSHVTLDQFEAILPITINLSIHLGANYCFCTL